MLHYIYIFMNTMISIAQHVSHFAFANSGKSQLRNVSTLKPGKPPFIMVASIGNPEPDYKGTRHNVGSFVLDSIVGHVWDDFKPFQKHSNLPQGLYSSCANIDSRHSNLFLFKSIYSFMNLQGTCISKVWNTLHRVQSSKNSTALVIVHDELQMPLGKVQIRRQNTSARGHNGLRSINQMMGMGYTKIGIGIGKPLAGGKDKAVADYVLSSFKRDEIETLTHEVVPQVAHILEEMSAGKFVFESHQETTTKKK